MDELNLQPDALGISDTTFDIEGYDDQIEQIENAYPEEDFRTPLEKQEAEKVAQESDQVQPQQPQQPQQPEAQQPQQPEAQQPQQPSPEQIAQQKEAEKQAVIAARTAHLKQRVYDEETGTVTEDSILDWHGNKIAEQANGQEVIKALKLTRDYNPEKEDRVYELLTGLNQQHKLEAFHMIREDPELTAIHDHNNDGEITYADFFDTTNLNGGDGLTEEEDKVATTEWLEAMLNPDLEQRAKAIWQQYGAGQDMALYINRRRKGYFDPSWEEDLKSSGGGAWFDGGADLLEGVGSIGDVMQGRSWHEDSTFDDDLLQHKNTQSLEFLVNNPIATTQHSKDIYEGVYWGTTALTAIATYGLVGGTTSAAGLTGLGGGIKGLTTTGLRKGIIADTVVPGAFRVYSDHGVGMMRKKGPIEWLTDNYGDGAEMFGPTAANMMNSPHFKMWDNIVGEASLAFGFGSILKGGYHLFKHAQKQIGPIAHGAQQWGPNIRKLFSTSKHSNSTGVGGEILNADAFVQKGKKQLENLKEAGAVQLKKTTDGFRNPFVSSTDDPQIGFGAYKQANRMVGQGWSKVQGTIRQVVNDLDEMRYQVGSGKVGSTDSLFSQVELAKAAKGGVSPNKITSLAKDLVEDPIWKRQLSDFNPLKKGVTTRQLYSDSAEKSIREILGRDSGRLNPKRFWGKGILNGKLSAKSFESLSAVDQWAIKNMEVQDAVNKSLLIQLRDSANVAGELLGKTDLYSIDGPMRRITDNLTAGLSQVEKTQYTWKLARQMMEEGNGTLNKKQINQIEKLVSKRSRIIQNETRKNVQIMARMIQEQGDEELAGALLDVFKVSDDIHNWTDFNAFMKQKVVGGEFQGVVKPGAVTSELRGVMIQSMLSGPKTPLRALIGTTTNSYLNSINEVAGAMIRSPFTNDIASRKASVAKLKGMFELIPESFDVFRKQWNAKFNANIADIRTRYSEAPTRTDQLWEAQRAWAEQNGSPGDKAAFYISNIARQMNNNKLFGWSPRALAAVDETFKHLLTRARSKEIAMRTVLEEAGEDWSKITPDMLRQAEDLHYSNLLDGEGNINLAKDSWLKKQYEEVTLTSELQGAAAKLDTVFKDIPALSPFYLFARTGINGLNFTYKNTPLLGILHKESLDILRHTGDDFTELARKYGITNANELANARNLFAGRQAVGAATVMSISGMYMGGQLTGNGPADRQLRQQWINAGWKPNHLYIGDVGFNYRTLEPYNTIFSAIADIGDNMELMGSEWAEKRLQAAAFVIGRGLVGKTYMSGLDQLMQIVQMKPGAMDKAAADIFNNSIPLAGMRNEFGKWINPHMKELNSDMWSSIRNRNQASEFLAGEDKLPPKSDLLNGKPINNWNIIGRSFNAVSPISLDIRNDSPGRRLLLDSNYDLKTTTYSYGGYSLAKDAHVRAHFQNAIGTVPVSVGFKEFKNVEDALNHLATRDDIKKSMANMKADGKNAANWDLDPNTYPHNTVIDNVMNQARSKAWAKINKPDHPAFNRVQALKTEKDGKTNKTRNNRQEILDLSFPQRSIEDFPK